MKDILLFYRDDCGYCDRAHRALAELMDELPEKQRSCMQLRDIEGKAYKEIAEVMGISEQQVKVSIFRARQTIHQRFIETEKYGL